MYHVHPDAKAGYAAARHADMLADAARDRLTRQAAVGRPAPALLRATIRWATPVRVLRGSGPAPAPAAA
jgi:hypothetical protein